MSSDDQIPVVAMVHEFHEAFDLLIADEPTVDVHTSTRDLRIDLMAEEVEETRQAALAGDVVGIADGLANLVYVAHPVYRADGKVLKSDRYTPPDIASCLAPDGGTR